VKAAQKLSLPNWKVSRQSRNFSSRQTVARSEGRAFFISNPFAHR
jgi:hypothetical protein